MCKIIIVLAEKCRLFLATLVHRCRCWHLMVILSLPVLCLGIIGNPRFNDGVWHLKCVRAWCEQGTRPIQVASKNNFNIYHEESPLWYGINMTVCQLTGGYSYYTVQCVQTLFFALILWLVYLLTKHFAGSYRAKYAVLLVGMTPILPVCAVLTFIDLLCAAIILLIILLLIKKQFWWCALAMAGLWYSKRTGMILLPPFFLLFAADCLMHYRHKIIYAVLTISGSLLLISLLIIPDLQFRAAKFGSDDMVVRELVKLSTKIGVQIKLHNPPPPPQNDGVVIKYKNDKNSVIPEITNYYYAASNRPAAVIPLPNFLQWFGFALPLLTALLFWQLCSSRLCRHELWRRYMVLGLPAVLFFLLWLIFARRYGRYLVVIFPVFAVILSALCRFNRKSVLFCIIAAVVLIQYCAVIVFMAKTVPLDADVAQVLSYLKQQRSSPQSKIFWEEWEMASYYIPGTDATFTHEIFSSNAIVSNLLHNNINTVIVAKRFNYNFTGAINEKGWPRHILEAFEKSPGVSRVLDNPQYSVYQLR